MGNSQRGWGQSVRWTESALTEARHRLVAQDLETAGIEHAAVLRALRTTPRHEFVSREQRDAAYLDMALPIGAKQTISSPFIVAVMTQELDPQPTDRVLEIGTGSGYQAAVLSSLVQDVYSIEIVESLGRRARSTLQRLKYTNVHVRLGDGYLGWPEEAPFDKIIVTCSPRSGPRKRSSTNWSRGARSSSRWENATNRRFVASRRSMVNCNVSPCVRPCSYR